MNALFIITKLLLIVGGLNWGLVGAFQFNLVDAIFGEGSVGSNVVYIVVGIAAIITIFDLFRSRTVAE
ncbi:uncharacterized membrane protein YuzA (DUF378 family) [Leucobacter exalbidus]|uniref:Uncharacterized membrane protein YuzA (DUF378 family) n=1 Tax=Leucobacter exalbidus TaxID=662960 RepID=A0A940T2T1_9MICO|nr:uncharacterized membrane protein YuzA (DUF378 family) [Leucobacter exalbidus]